MPIARISGQGLAAIGFCVCVLWSCVLLEQFRHRSAVTERARVVREVREMRRQQRSEPASSPSRLTRKRVPVTAG